MLRFLESLTRVGCSCALVVGLMGCAYTGYLKEVVTRLDGDGRLVEVMITERIEQPENVAHPIVFEYIRLLPVNAPQMEPTEIRIPINANPPPRSQ